MTKTSRRKTRGFASLLAAAGLMAAIPGLLAEAPTASAAANQSKGECFWGHDASGFSAPDNTKVYIRAGLRDVYELSLFGPCLDVDWAQSIALRSRSGDDFICAGNNVNYEIISPSHTVGRQRCEVNAVRKLTPDQVAALPKRDRP
jgi:hypothetical protein